MRLKIVPLVAAAAAVTFSAAPDPLRVLRSAPGEIAAPSDTLIVSFDRPVAGALDDGVDAADVVRISPAIDARVEWRDPVTLRVIPRAPLPRGALYTVTVSTEFRAMDGSTLAAPHIFTFRVRGPTLIAGDPVRGGRDTTRHVAQQPTITLVYDAPVRAADIARTSVLEPLPSCRDANGRTPARVPLAPAPGSTGARDSVVLVAQRALPANCTAALLAPRELDIGGTATTPMGSTRWLFRTHGEFRITEARCTNGRWCPHGPLMVRFSTPVHGRDLARALGIAPKAAVEFDTTRTAADWRLGGTLAPRTAYALIMNPSLRDIFGQSLTGNPSVGVRTTGYAPDVQAPFGRLTVERTGFRTLAVRTMNVDTLLVERLPIHDTAIARMLAGGEWTWLEYWNAQPRQIVRQRIPLTRSPDRARVVAVSMPTSATGRAVAPLHLVRVRDAWRSDDTTNADEWFRLALVQVTDLGVHAKIGDDAGAVWVTDARNGAVRAGAQVALHDSRGAVLARGTTNADGMVQLQGFTWRRRASTDDEGLDEGYVAVSQGDDRALLPVRDGDPDLAPWRFGIPGAYGVDRATVAGAVFTERDLYRPGETVYAKAIVRGGMLGMLEAPGPRDTVRWVRRDAEYRITDSIAATLSEFGTADVQFPIPADAGLGDYRVALEWRHRQQWQSLASTGYRIAEYRPAEFLVDVAATRTPKRAGDTLGVHVAARYLFGGAMAGAAVQWSLTSDPVPSYALEIPGADSWMIGDTDDGWLGTSRDAGTEFVASGQDSLGADGTRDLRVTAPAVSPGTAMRLTLSANVSDVNRRVVGGRATAVLHPADFYVAARAEGDDWFWRSNDTRTVRVTALRPDGQRLAGVSVQGVLVRREWHRVQRLRGGTDEYVGEWVADTVGRCTVTTTLDGSACALRAQKGGAHSVILTARDAGGRETVTAFTRWVVGPEWVPWNDDNQLRLDVIADKARYAPGDTATIMFASPFTNAEAWITVEREGVLSQQRLRLTSGTTTFKLPITEAHAPNVFVSMLVTKGRTEKPGTLGDPGRPGVRVGFANLRVTPDAKRLAVTVTPDRAEYRPGDSARVRVQVRDAGGRAVRSEVTLWAVDQGVLSLTGFRTPDPLDLLYQPRGLALTLASTLANVAPQLPEGEKATREPGGGGGAADDGVLRSRFRTTAFFLGSVITDANGTASATASLPDNLTTFRVMAVAVTRGDRFGSGDSSVLVTRPLVARPALPRFLRAGDAVDAGVTVNRREGATGRVRVSANVTGASLTGRNNRDVTVEAGRGVEVRFPFRVPAGDAATFRFDAQGGRDRDAVQVTIPVRPDSRPIVTSASVFAATATSLTLPVLDDVDAARSTLSVSLGASPLALVRAAAEGVRSYPWACTEQLASTALPLLALMHVNDAPATAAADVARTVRALQQRQRSDGGIGYWGAGDWTTPWLTAHAALVLVQARDAGVAVDSMVLERVGDYLAQAVGEPESEYAPTRGRAPISRHYALRSVVLSEYVAGVEALRALGRANVSAENDLLRQAAQLSVADRARLALLLAERGDAAPARTLLTGLWSQVRVEAQRAWLPDSTNFDGFYFASPMRATGALLRATLAVEPDHPLVQPLMMQVVRDARAGSGWFGVTPDLATIVRALATIEERQRSAARRGVQLSVAGRVLFTVPVGTAAGDTTLALSAIPARNLRTRGDSLVLTITPLGDGPALFASASLRTLSRTPPTRPLDRGIVVERWTEDPETARPITQANAGALVRVRLRITVPEERTFVAVEDPLPAGFEPVDLTLRTAVLTMTTAPVRETPVGVRNESFWGDDEDPLAAWSIGRWDAGYWTPFEHRELRDDRVMWSASTVYPGRYTLTYLARATTPGRFVRPPAHAEEMYDPSVFGRTEGSVFTIVPPR
jgi:alpha-2-macroglobulin